MAKRPLKRGRGASGSARRAGAPQPDVHTAVAMPANRSAATSPPASARIAGLDALRGIAIVAMIGYHFCFDLRYFGIVRSDFEHDLRWLAARTLILSSFLLIAGISVVLAQRGHASATRWLRHVGVIAGAALLVTAASWLMFPQSFIWFGVLHAIAAALLLARPLAARPVAAAIVGAVVIVTGLAYTNDAFDNRVLGWLGFMTQKPVTEDYVPLFPWAGVLFLGLSLGHVLVRTRFTALHPLASAPRALRWLGRHSLVVYLVHQPIMIGLLWLATRH